MDEDDVRDLLADVEDPALGDDIVSLGLVNDVSIDGTTVEVSLGLGAPYAADEDLIADRVRDVLATHDLDAELSAGIAREVPPEERMLPEVKNIIAVASGKGGVGKSTVSVNLAAGLARLGARVGLFDSDIYGPNVPRMVAPEELPQVTDEETIPPQKYGVKLISMDFFLDDDDPVIWRGPMVQKMLTRLWEDVVWGPTDYLVVDLPPGTGDAQLSLLQSLPVAGGVIVTTPEQVALDDARKGMQMFEQFDTPVLGVVENMSSFTCPTCGDDHDILGRDGGERLASEHAVPFLGSVPIDPSVRMDGEDEDPVVLDEENETGETFRTITGNLANEVGEVVRRKHSSLVTEPREQGQANTTGG